MPTARQQDGGYTYFPHEADVGIIGRGSTLEAAFEAAARAVFATMVDIASVRALTPVRFAFSEDDAELALVRWLNRLLAEASHAGLALGRFRLRRQDGAWLGEAWGEPWRRDLERGVEVKGATLTALSVERFDEAWEVRCVVDV